MNSIEYTKDSLAIILLCSNIGINFKISNLKPFTALEWSKFAKLLFNSSIRRPENLFNLDEEQLISKLFISKAEAKRVIGLLSRAGQLSFELDEFKNMGIRIITRADNKFPSVLKEKLKEKCPPIIYYCGDLNILNNKFIGVVGSRNIDILGMEFTKEISNKIVSEKYSLISGGAKGVDSIAQNEVLIKGGKVISFIADSMVAKIRKKEIREEISKNNLLLMSTINPKSGFTVYSAMDRNKYIYAISDTTVVISADFNKGGTWAGAIENLKYGWTPILVRSGEDVPRGNKEILKKGGNSLSENLFNKSFSELIDTNSNKEDSYYECDLLSLLDTDISNYNSNIQSNASIDKESNYDAYIVILDIIKTILKEELTLEQISEKLNVNKKQTSDWINRAIKDGIVIKLNKPVRYRCT